MVFILPVIAFVLALSMTPFVKRAAIHLGVVDKPGKDPLKIHEDAISLCGGMVLFICLIISLVTFLWKYTIGPNEFKAVVGILLGSMIIFFTGLRDDIKGMNPTFRLVIQILAGCILIYAGLGLSIVPFKLARILLALFYIVGAINAYNVIDGMDGLCVGVSMISSAGFLLLALIKGNVVMIILSSVICFSLLGILPYNAFPAKIFLGNAGSGLLGFLLGTLLIMSTMQPLSLSNFMLPVFFVAVPVLDMAFAILRRLYYRKPLFLGDRDHLYDLMLKRGWSQPKVWAIMCGLQIILVAIGFAQARLF